MIFENQQKVKKCLEEQGINVLEGFGTKNVHIIFQSKCFRIRFNKNKKREPTTRFELVTFGLQDRRTTTVLNGPTPKIGPDIAHRWDSKLGHYEQSLF
jgi:hypothetical protein